MRMDHSAHEIDVFWPQAARLGQAQADKRAQEHTASLMRSGNKS
jgi:hypothetical protein